MDPQIRNFRDFLHLYNKLTETCFLHCTDNFFSRNISQEETNCVDKCVIKFSNVNQKVMGIYVEAQTAINNRRMAELELQMKKQQEAQLAQQQQQEAQLAQQQQQESISTLATGNSEGELELIRCKYPHRRCVTNSKLC